MALGGCYERLRKWVRRAIVSIEALIDSLRSPFEATKAFKRALLSAEPGEIALVYRLANIAQEQGEMDDFAAYHRHIIAVGPKEDLPLSDYARSYLALAKLEIERGAEAGDLMAAERYLNKVRESTLEVRCRSSVCFVACLLIRV